MQYKPGAITIIAAVDPANYWLGDENRGSDYLQLHSDSQSSAIDWQNPVSAQKYTIAGLPVEGGNRILTVQYVVNTPGLWSFAVGAYDDIGNLNSAGTAAVVTLFKELTPVKPSALKLQGYDAENGILTLIRQF